MNKIIIIGDSLAYNRPDGILDHQRWPSLLNESIKSKYRLENLSMGSSTSRRFKKLSFSNLVENDIVIVQIGIVDCAPRLFTKFENKIIAKLPNFAAKKIISYYKKKRNQEKSRAYVGEGEFEKNVTQLFEVLKGNKIIYLKILPAGDKFLSSNPNVNKAIANYNHILEKVTGQYNNVALIDFDIDEIDNYTLGDGYHLNEKGHLLTSELVLKSILTE